MSEHSVVSLCGRKRPSVIVVFVTRRTDFAVSSSSSSLASPAASLLPPIRKRVESLEYAVTVRSAESENDELSADEHKPVQMCRL